MADRYERPGYARSDDPQIAIIRNMRKANENRVERGLPEEPTSESQLLAQRRGKFDSKPLVSVSDPSVPTFEDLRLLTAIILTTAEVALAFDAILAFLNTTAQGLKNFKAHSSTKTAYSYKFESSSFTCFKFSIFKTVEDQVGVCCNRLNGDSVLMSKVWQEFKVFMAERGLYEEEMLLEQFDFEDGFFSEDEDDLDLEALMYLDLTQDENFVQKLIEEIQDVNLCEHALLLLTFNCQREENLNVVLDHSAALFDGITTCLDQNEENLVVARCCARLCVLMTENNQQLNVQWEDFEVFMKTLVNWSLGSAQQKLTVPVDVSEEAAIFCSRTLAALYQSMGEDDKARAGELTYDFETFTEECEFDEVCEAVNHFTNSILVC